MVDFLEVYDDTTYKVNRMANALQTGQTGVATRCAQDLMAKEEFDACYYAAAYYYLPMGQLPEYFQATWVGLKQEASNTDAWNSIFNLYRQALCPADRGAHGGVYLRRVPDRRMAGRDECGADGGDLLDRGEPAAAGWRRQAQSTGLSGQNAYDLLSLVLEGVQTES